MYVKKFRCRKIPIVFLNCSFFSEILVGLDREKSGNTDCVFSAFRCSKRLLNFPEVPSKKGSRIKQ